MTLLDVPALKLYAIAASIVGLHLLVLAGWTGGLRVLRKQYVNPEDAKFSKGAEAEVDHADVQRVKRAHQNLLENALVFFPVAFLYALTSPSTTAAGIYFFTFVGARLLHSMFYLWGRQPFRTMSFAIAAFSLIGMAVHVLRVAA